MNWKEFYLKKVENAREDYANALEIHTPHLCQNGHGATLITFLYRGCVVKEYFLPDGEDECKCPKGEIGEGYRPVGDSFVKR